MSSIGLFRSVRFHLTGETGDLPLAGSGELGLFLTRNGRRHGYGQATESDRRTCPDQHDIHSHSEWIPDRVTVGKLVADDLSPMSWPAGLAGLLAYIALDIAATRREKRQPRKRSATCTAGSIGT